jgi:hypothetical protein
MGRVALIAQLDDGAMRLAQRDREIELLSAEIDRLRDRIERLTVAARFEPIMRPLYPP